MEIGDLTKIKIPTAISVCVIIVVCAIMPLATLMTFDSTVIFNSNVINIIIATIVFGLSQFTFFYVLMFLLMSYIAKVEFPKAHIEVSYQAALGLTTAIVCFLYFATTIINLIVPLGLVSIKKVILIINLLIFFCWLFVMMAGAQTQKKKRTLRNE